MSQESTSTKRLVSASAIMASGTLVSRALGLVRVMLIAFILGNGTRQADMLSLATMVPNSLYILFAGGALNTVLVPQIVRAAKHDDGGEAYTNRIMTAFLLIVGVVAVIVTIGAPLVTALYTSDGWRAPELSAQYASMVALTYLTLPQIFFYGAFFLLSQVLNARDKFGPMMWAPIANNVVSITVLSTYFIVWGNTGDHTGAFTREQVLLLGIGSTLGIAAQTAVLVPFLRKVGFRFRPRFDLRGTGLGKTFSLTKWTIGFVAVNQAALVVVQRLATSATAGGEGAGATVYSNAHLIWILPHSLITVSLATAMLPSASRLAAAGDIRGVAAESMRTMRLALIALVPAAIGFAALATPITGFMFGHGQGQGDAVLVARTLIAFAIGLVPFTVQFLTLRTYYALEDTRTPFLQQLIIATLNAGLAILLVRLVSDPDWIAAALALAYSLAYLVGVIVSFQVLKHRLPDLNGGDIVMHILRLGIAAGVGGVAAYFAAGWISGAVRHQVWGNMLAIVAGLVILALAYVAITKVLQVREMRSLSTLVRSRMKHSDPGEQASTPTTTIPPAQPPSLAEDLMPTELTPIITDDMLSTQSWLPAFMPQSPATPAHPTTPVEAYEPAVEEPYEPTAAEPYEPEPLSPVEAPADQAHQRPDTIASPGVLLTTRFRLDDLVGRRAGTETWRAHDLVLSRDVMVHVLAPGDSRIPDVLSAARQGATATDSRFLRVLDAVEVREFDTHIGAYIVCEYASGPTLAQLLQYGALSAIEGAWLTRELADALAGMHGQGLFHQQINPDNVIVTNNGAVRLMGFGVESALVGDERPALAWSEREAGDVKALGKILYATLVRHWPGEAGWGLPVAPIIAGETAAPHDVASGMSPGLDRICAATLTERGAAGDSRITTASQLSSALSSVLGTADASMDLEHRVRVMDRIQPQPPVAASAAAIATAVAMSPVPTQTAPTSPFARPVTSPAEPATSPAAPAPAPVTSRTPDSHPTPAAFETADTKKPSRLYLWIIALIAAIVLVWALISLADNAADDDDSGDPSASASAEGSESDQEGQSEAGEPPAGEPISVVSVDDFDPEADNGNNEENPDDVLNAVDGDPATGWSTLRYHNQPDLGGLKAGVGLVLDLGEPVEVSQVNLAFEAPGTSVEIRVPNEADATLAPMDSESQWNAVAKADSVDAQAALTLDEPTTTRYVLVYLTSLPEVSEARFLTTINEIEVS
ncbi:MAG: murein biosynthesis integral membrane protein MurJ [Arachnia sp.]